MSAAASEVSRVVKARVLRAAAASAGRDKLALPNIAHHHGLTLEQVKAIVQDHGWPRPESMMRAAAILERGADPSPAEIDPTTGAGAAGSGHAAQPMTSSTGVSSAMVRMSPVPDRRVPSADGAQSLIAAGRAHSSKRINAAAERAAAALDRLVVLLKEDRDRTAERKRVAAERERARAAARAEVERLAAELEAARAKLRAAGGAAGTDHRKAAASTGTHSCTAEGCDRVLSTAQGLAMHRYRAHGLRKGAS